MSFVTRYLVVVLAIFTLANLAACALVPWLWRRELRLARSGRADALRRVRLLPAAVAFAAMAWTAVSFALLEPREAGEPVGVMLVMLAACGGVLLTGAAARVLLAIRRSRRELGAWLTGSEPATLAGVDIPVFVVASAFPVVAMAGLWRPRLLIARCVLETCSPRELELIVAHERAHLMRGDNLTRLLSSATPDVLAWLPAGRRLIREWDAAAEDAADDSVGALGDTARLRLAEVLIRITRLAPPDPLPALPASALYRGESLDRRVRRLLVPAPPAPRQWSAARRSGTIAASVAVSLITLRLLQDVVEAVVAFLP